NKIVKHFIPPIVGGTIIFIVGLSLMPVALDSNIYNAAGATTSQNVLLAVITGSVLIFCAMLGSIFRKKGSFLRITSVIIALVVGCFVARYMGILDFSSVGEAKWF